MNDCSCAGLSSIDTPTMTRPLSLYLPYSSTNDGISDLQGSHQVAQKFRSITLPLKSDILTGTLYSFFRTKSYFACPSTSQPGRAAGAPACAGDDDARLRCWVPRAVRSIGSVSRASASAAAAAMIQRDFISNGGYQWTRVFM